MKNKPSKTASTQEQANETGYHQAVLLQECITALSIEPNGVYVDTTFGGGGHSREILKHLEAQGKLIGFDQDADALQNRIVDERFVFIHQNFRELKRFLRLEGIAKVNGILADLGVSSHQFDTAERGFSYRFDAPLDMRMDSRSETSAMKIVKEYSADRLQKIFSEFGEVRNAKTLALSIVEERQKSSLNTTEQLKSILERCRMGDRFKYFGQVFQALRMEVNEELEVLKSLLLQSEELLEVGGRLAVITFHSLEDRLVKNFMRNGSFEDEPEKDFFGRTEKKFKLITKKPIVASEEEQRVNTRSRSAKLRVAEKI